MVIAALISHDFISTLYILVSTAHNKLNQRLNKNSDLQWAAGRGITKAYWGKKILWGEFMLKTLTWMAQWDFVIVWSKHKHLVSSPPPRQKLIKTLSFGRHDYMRECVSAHCVQLLRVFQKLLRILFSLLINSWRNVIGCVNQLVRACDVYTDRHSETVQSGQW